MSELHHMGLAALAAGLRARRFSSVELAEAFLGRIERSQGALNAFITITREQALADAEAADRALAGGAHRCAARAQGPVLHTRCAYQLRLAHAR
jgi:aspartyl-tRNA(Asn)/glutamyl-tRNA(Gln) amidotransferase subunit A